MMFIDNKEEAGADGQRFNEPNIGVPIKKRPFQLTSPSSLESSVPALDKFSLMPKHFTPRSPLDFSPLGFDHGNPSSSNMDKPAGVETNPLHDLNAIDMERNYCPLNGDAAKLQLRISGNMVKEEKISQCSTDLSLTGPSTISSKASLKSSHNLSKNMEKKSVFDLNLPTAESWDSDMDAFTSENNNIAHRKTVEVIAKQGSVSGMIPHGMGSGVFSNGVVAGLVPKGAVNNLKSSEKCNPSEFTLDLQLKLPPRPELRMKDLEPVCSSDLSLSLSGKDMNSSTEPVNVKPKLVQNFQKSEGKEITNPNVKAVAQNQVIVKEESREVSLPQKVMQLTVSKNQSLTSGTVVKKEPVDTASNAQHPLGKLLDKSPSSASEPRLVKQVENSGTNNLTKGIDLNSATPLPEASIVSKAVNPVLAETVVAGKKLQPATLQSDACNKREKIDNRNLSLNMPCVTATSSPLVGTEDIKPVITPRVSPALVVDNRKRMASMASDGLSQGSAEMDCSEEGQNLSKSVTTCKTMEKTNCETNASSSSSVAKIPKQEPSSIGEFENVGIRETQSRDNVRSLVPSCIPNSNENQIQAPMLVEASLVQNNECDIPSKLIDLPNKNVVGVCLDMEAGGSISRSPSTSKSIHDKDVDLSIGRDNDTSNRQTIGNDILHGKFKRTDFGPDRAQVERKKSQWPSWDEGSNIYSNRCQRWEGPRFSHYDGDRFENEDNLGQRAGFNMTNRQRQTNRFNSRFGHNKYNRFRYTRTNSSSDMNFDEGNDCRTNRPHPHFQNRRRLADVSPRGGDELDAPVFEHSNHYRRVDHTIHRERSSSPGSRRGLHQWTPPSEMVGGHPDLLTRVNTRVRSPGRRPFFKKDNLDRRHVSPQYNRARKPGRGMHWNNGPRRFDRVRPHGPVADAHDLEAYDEFRCHGGEMMPFHGRYPDNDGAYSDGGGPHGRVRNYETAMPRAREVGDQDEYRYSNRGPHGRRDANPNNNGDKSKRRRF